MEEFKGDKRTKAYKEWKAKFEANQSKGLGDTVEKVTKATGIKKVVKAVLGDDCGCDERKAKLNKLVRYKVVNCLEQDEYEFLKEVFERNKKKVTPEEQIKFKNIFERVYNKRLTSDCLSCSFVSEIYKPLNNLYKNYERL
jgi:hypothetical protein